MGLYKVSEETGKVAMDLSDDRIEFRHPRCGFKTSMSIAEFRAVDSIECPNCKLVLVSHTELVESFESGLRSSARITRRRDRAATRRDILRDLDRLRKG